MLSRQLRIPAVASRRLMSSLQTANYGRQWDVFPRESEGREYDVNFSLLEDGITSVGNAFRNARISLLKSHLPEKTVDGNVVLNAPKMNGNFKIVESGDSISHEEFAELREATEDILSSKKDLFVEDAAVSSHNTTRMGVRIVTQDAATALAFRKLLIPIPNRPLDHRNRFDGWHNDERWRVSNPVWQGDRYEVLDRPVASKGVRPIAAFIGGDHDKLAVQFVERDGVIVGGDILAGTKVPLRGLIESICLASNVLVNTQQKGVVALPSTTFTVGTSVAAVIGGNDELVTDLKKKEGLAVHGHYGNIFSADGVSALFNGYVGSPVAANDLYCHDVPNVVVDKLTANALEPVNMVNPVDTLYIVEAGAKGKKALAKDEAMKRILQFADNDDKADDVNVIFSNTKVFIIGSAKDI